MLKLSNRIRFGDLPWVVMHRSDCSPMLPLPVAAFVFRSSKTSGMSMPKISRSLKWLTIIIRPSPFDPGGRSTAQDEKSVTSYAVSKKYANSSFTYETFEVSAR